MSETRKTYGISNNPCAGGIEHFSKLMCMGNDAQNVCSPNQNKPRAVQTWFSPTHTQNSKRLRAFQKLLLTSKSKNT
jgi:hypothetical protein